MIAIVQVAHKKTDRALALALWIALAAAHMQLADRVKRTRDDVDDDARIEAVNTSALATILGELRASAADLMWVKTERYLHRGVAFEPHISAEDMAREGVVHTRPEQEHHHEDDEHDESCAHHHESGEACEHDAHEAMAPLIPTASKDWRGFVGTLHRELHPWQGPDAPHEHTSGDQLLPWFRMVTWSNPHHWRAYLTGTWWLMHQEASGALDEALAFVDEGVRNNPDVFQMHLMRGRVLIRLERWDAARAAFEAAVRVGRRNRPEGGVAEPPVWTASNEEDFAAALRYIPLILLRKMNRPDAARDALRDALRLRPHDAPLRHLAEELHLARPSN